MITIDDDASSGESIHFFVNSWFREFMHEW